MCFKNLIELVKEIALTVTAVASAIVAVKATNQKNKKKTRK